MLYLMRLSVMLLCGVTLLTRFFSLGFQTVIYCKLLKKKALKIVKQRNLIILHDRSKIHSSRKTAAFLKTEKMKSIMLPGKSYDLNPIENCFGLLKRKLEKEPTRSLEEASWALSAVLWIQNHKSIDLYYTNPVKSSQQIQLALEETYCTVQKQTHSEWVTDQGRLANGRATNYCQGCGDSSGFISCYHNKLFYKWAGF